MRLIRDLNPESQKMLERIYRASKHHQVRERAKCILLSFQGTTIEELSGIFGVTRKTIYNWLTAWEDRKLIGFYNRRGRGRKPKLTEAQGQQVIDWVKEEPKSLKKILHKRIFCFKIICKFEKNMKAMDLQTRKLEFIQEFLKLQSEEVISQFENLMKKRIKDSFKPMSIEEFNKGIDKSEDDFKNGRYKTSSELLAKYK